MNEQLQQELAAWLTKLREATDAGASFAIEQAPLIVQEKIAYGRVFETTQFAAAVLAAVVLALVSLRAYRSTRGLDVYSANVTGEMFCIFGGIGSVFMAVGSIIEFEDMVQVWVAPRIYILEWLAGLLK